jgi:putative phage regulatory protein
MYIYDSNIRKVLYSEFLKEKKFTKNPEDTIVIDEFSSSYSSARIDISVLNGSLHGYEIKSERDTLERLPKQIEYYTKIFEYITVVTTDKYTEKIIEIVPDFFGIFLIEKKKNKLKLKKIRNSKKNKNIDYFELTKLLWKEELKEILKENDIKKVSSLTRLELTKKVFENIPQNIIKKFVLTKIKNRTIERAVSIQELYDDCNSK